MLNFNIYTHGYVLNRFQKKSIHDTIEKLTKKIPYDSCVRLDLEFFNKRFIGKITVKISHKIFFAKSEGNTVKMIINSVNKKLLKQVERWKKSRTLEEVTEITNLSGVNTDQKVA